MNKSRKALQQTGLSRLIISGGVSANRQLRLFADSLVDEGIEVFYPRLEFCTDNGAMIALAGSKRLVRGESTENAVKVRPRWPLSELQ